MQRFLLQENAKNFRARLAEAADEGERRQLRTMLATVERELALLDAAEAGAGVRPWPIGSDEDLRATRASLIDDFRREFGLSEHVAYLIDPSPGLLFVEVNHAFELATGLARESVVGQPLFVMFPENPDAAAAGGVSRIYASLRRVAQTGRPDAMPVLRYDVRGPDGAFVERYWRPVNAPLPGAGRLILLLHVVDEVTDEVLQTRRAG